MRLLFFTPSPEAYMRAPLLAEEQVICGPDYTDGKTATGLTCHKTPLGDFDVSSFIETRSGEAYPDLVVCLVDASWRCVPTGLARLRCPTVLLVADTHHLHNPISRMVEYARQENFDRTIILYGRHHALFFKAAGIQNLYWLPGLSFPYSEKQVAEAPRSKRHPVVALYGQISRIHVRRRNLLEAMAAARLPLSVQMGPQTGCLPFYGQALVGFNASLNGDLNLRVFEVLASGAALLGDRLGAGSGLDRLLSPGRDYLCYDDSTTLVAAAKSLLANPAEAAAMGANGRRWLLEHYSESHRRELFHQIVNGAPVPADFRIDEPALPSLPSPDSPDWKSVTQCYESLQELHRTQENVSLQVPGSLEALWLPLAQSLPRVRLSTRSADLELTCAEDTDTLSAYARQRPGQPELGRVLHSAEHNFLAEYRAPEAELQESTSAEEAPLAAIRQLIRKGFLGEAFEQAKRGLEAGRNQASYLLLIAELALLSGKIPLATKLLADARAKQAPSDECRRLEQALQPAALRLGAGTLLHQHAKALLEFGYHEELISLCTRVLSQNPEEQAAKRSLIRAYAKHSQFEACLKLFHSLRRQRCVEDAELCLVAAQACVRAGPLDAALGLLQEAAEQPALRIQALCDLTELQIGIGKGPEARRSLQLLEMVAPADGRVLLLREWVKTALSSKK